MNVVLIALDRNKSNIFFLLDRELSVVSPNVPVECLEFETQLNSIKEWALVMLSGAAD